MSLLAALAVSFCQNRYTVFQAWWRESKEQGTSQCGSYVDAMSLLTA